MAALQRSDILDAWAAKLQAAADSHPAINFDGRVAFPAWLSESARDQAERVLLALDATPAERRDIAEAERIIWDAGMAFLEAWMLAMEAFGTGAESWARDAAMAAGDAYRARFVEIAPTLGQGGQA